MTWYANERTDGPTSVYVIECAGHVKIGLAVDVGRRRASLQAACPLPMTVAGTLLLDSFQQARSIEKAVHLRLAECRLHGEWFLTTVAVGLAELEKFRECEYAPPTPGPAKPAAAPRWTPAEQRIAKALEF